MRALLAREAGGPEVLELREVPDPVAGPGQVLVRVQAAGVGPWDLLGLSGRLPVPVEYPYVPGGEAVGEVVALGAGVNGLEVGDRVMSAVFQGCLAELAALDADSVGPAPATWSPVDAACLPVDASTAHLALADLGVGDGDVLLLAGAGTGVGHFAAQVAGARGARVLATAGVRNHERLRRLGVAVVVDYHEDWVAALAEHAPADAMLDIAGSDAITAAFDLLRDGARVVTVVRGDAVTPPRGITVAEQHTHGERARLTEVARLADQGGLLPLVAETFPLERAVEAVARLGEPREPGKVVVTVAH